MNSQPNPHSSEERIANYLALVAKPMGSIPKEPKQNFLREIKTHVETLVDQYRDQGRSEDAAVGEALRMIGEPVVTGRLWAKSWLRANEPGTFWSAFAISAGALVLFQAFNYFLTPAITSRILAIPKAHLTLIQMLFGPIGAWVLWGLCAPLVVGVACGLLKPRRATGAMLLTSALYCLYSRLLLLKALEHMKAAMPMHTTVSPLLSVTFLSLTLACEFVMMAAPMIAAGKIARVWKINRLTRA